GSAAWSSMATGAALWTGAGARTCTCRLPGGEQTRPDRPGTSANAPELILLLRRPGQALPLTLQCQRQSLIQRCLSHHETWAGIVSGKAARDDERAAATDSGGSE